MTYRGTVYGLPLNFKVITLIYNKKLVPTPPKTTAELVGDGQEAHQRAAGHASAWSTAYTDFYYHAALMNGFGGGVFDRPQAAR